MHEMLIKLLMSSFAYVFQKHLNLIFNFIIVLKLALLNIFKFVTFYYNYLVINIDN